jgi:hypothetical protein
MERKEFLSTLSSLTLLSLTGCLTTKLYEAQKYDEAALSFLVTEDGSQLVVLGEKYHYIFHDISPSLKRTLLSPVQLRTQIYAYLSDFYVRRDNVVTGDYTLSLSQLASDEQRRSAIDAGFVAPGPTLSGHLKGIRYSAEGFPSTAQPQEFTQRYVVSVKEQDSESRVAGKILLTPITIAADGALILGGLILFWLCYGIGPCH